MGAFAVGKTSLVRRYVHQVFEENYKATLGVNINTKRLEVDGRAIKMTIWDFEGQHPSNSESPEFNTRMRSYVSGAAGILLVSDGTRPWTVDSALDMCAQYLDLNPETPCVFLINKSDLTGQWALSEAQLEIVKSSFPCFQTSALSGKNVEQGFLELARLLVETP